MFEGKRRGKRSRVVGKSTKAETRGKPNGDSDKSVVKT